eukprot:865729-Prorocentrum_minimum.AAC.1
MSYYVTCTLKLPRAMYGCPRETLSTCRQISFAWRCAGRRMDGRGHRWTVRSEEGEGDSRRTSRTPPPP